MFPIFSLLLSLSLFLYFVVPPIFSLSRSLSFPLSCLRSTSWLHVCLCFPHNEKWCLAYWNVGIVNNVNIASRHTTDWSVRLLELRVYLLVKSFSNGECAVFSRKQGVYRVYFVPDSFTHTR